VTEIPGSLTAASPFGGQDRAWAAKARAAAAAFWVRAFFMAAEHAPGAVTAARGALCRGAFRCSSSLRRGTRANARRMLGPAASPRQVDALGRRILSSFYLACCDIGRSFSASREQLFARVEAIEGDEHYQAARAAGKGLIVVTAHMGSFEVGMAALRDRERAKIHVVFRRDPFERFERLRSGLRRRLGVEEAPVDDGWTVWMRLRDALLADEVIVLQGDRVMPGQKGEPVPFLGGTIRLPAGLGIQVALDVVLIILAVMAGRVIPMFTNNGVTGANATRRPHVERWALGLLLALLAADALALEGTPLSIVALAACGVHALRWWLWQPWKTRQVPLVWVLHVAYLWVPIHLALSALAGLGLAAPSAAAHALTVGAVGGLIIGMMTRTARGHTARPLRADRYDTACYVLVLLAAVVRVALPLVAPAQTLAAVLCSAALWSAGFGLYAIRYWPILSRPRLDGRPG